MDYLGIAGIGFEIAKDIYAKVKEGPRSDYDSFQKGIKKTINEACKKFLKHCKESSEGLKFDYLEGWFEDEVFSNVMSAIEEQNPFTINSLLPKEKEDDFPEYGRKLLYQIVLSCLNQSLEFCTRDFIAWVKQEEMQFVLDFKKILKSIAQLDQLVAAIDALPKGWQAQPITYGWIQQRKKETLARQEEYERAYYKVSDHFPTMSGVICADLDCPNVEAIRTAKETLGQSNRHLFIVGSGGEGKTSLLFRLAVEYAKEGQICFWLKLDNCPKSSMDFDYAKRLLDSINKQAQELNTIAYLFVDNLFQGKNMLDALSEVWKREYSIRLITAERTINMSNLFSPNNNQMRVWSDNAECLCFHSAAEIQELNWKQPCKTMPISMEWKMLIVDRMISTSHELDQKRLENAKERAEFLTKDKALPLVELLFSVFTEYNKSIMGGRIQFDKGILMDWDIWDQQIGMKFPEASDSFRCIASLYRIGMPVKVSDLANYYGLKSNRFLEFLSQNYKDELNSPVILQSDDKGELYILPKHDMIPDLFFNFQTKTTFQVFISTWIQSMPEDKKKADISIALADWFFRTNDFKQAEKQYNKAIIICEKTYGIDNFVTALVYNNIAGVYKAQGEYVKALALYEKDLTISEKLLGKEHPDTAITYNNIAGVYHAQGDFEKAQKWFWKALLICEKELGLYHFITATTYNNLAGVYYAQGDYDKALEWFGKSLVIYEKVLGKEHPSNAITYNNLALVYHAQGDYDKALDWFRKALFIREKVLGKEHLNTATTYHNIALVFKAQEDYLKALEWYKKALIIREKVLGKEHPDTATSYNNIAVVHKAQGDYDKALEWYGKALVICEKVFGKEHPSTATIYNNIAEVYKEQGEYNKALAWYEKALAISENVLGKEHPDTATTYNNIARVYDAQGDFEKALEWYIIALRIVLVKLGSAHPNTITIFDNLSQSYYASGRDKAKFMIWLEEKLN